MNVNLWFASFEIQKVLKFAPRKNESFTIFIILELLSVRIVTFMKWIRTQRIEDMDPKLIIE